MASSDRPFRLGFDRLLLLLLGAHLAALPEVKLGVEQLSQLVSPNLARDLYDPVAPRWSQRSEAIAPFPADAIRPERTALAADVVKRMQALGYDLNREPGALTIVLLRGTNPDGTRNGNAPRPATYNDLLLLLEFVGDRPLIRFAAPATTEANAELPVHPDHVPFGGAAQILPGQHREKWELRSHLQLRRGEAFTGLMQVDELPVGFDRNGNGRIDRNEPRHAWLSGRDGGAFVFHPELDFPQPGTASSGCIVTERDRDFFQFVQLLQQSSQERTRRRHRWTATILDG